MAEPDVERLYRTYFPVIREKCRRALNDAAEAQDVAQETFARLWHERGRLANAEGIVSWIYRTSTRLVIDRYRRSTREIASDVDEELVAAAGGSSPERQLHSRQVLERLAARVPAAELEVALLSRVDGLQQLEIARVMGSSERTVRRLLQRFESRLAALGEAP